MLSVFPDLLTYNLLGISIVRVTIGMVMLYIGLMTVGVKRSFYTSKMQIKKYPLVEMAPRLLGVLEILVGSFMIIGFLTQIMAIVSAYLFLNIFLIEKHIGKIFDYPLIFYISMIVISLTMIILGPGVLAIDLPL